MDVNGTEIITSGSKNVIKDRAKLQSTCTRRVRHSREPTVRRQCCKKEPALEEEPVSL